MILTSESWVEVLVGVGQDFPWLRWLVVTTFVVLFFMFLIVAFRVIRGDWIPFWFHRSDETGIDRVRGSGPFHIDPAVLRNSSLEESASGMEPITRYMGEKDRQIDTLKEILSELKQDQKAEADRNTDFIAMMEIVADGVSSTLTHAYIKLENSFSIDYPYIIDSIQSAMANEKVKNPGVGVFVPHADGQSLVPIAWVGLTKSFEDYRPTPTVHSPEGWVWLYAHTRGWSDLTKERLQQSPPETRSMIASPLVANEEKLGVLAIYAEMENGFCHPMDSRHLASFAKLLSSLVYLDRYGTRVPKGGKKR
ncbi:GAF domain-containing protein [Desmospora activa]|uniref:GAF domain-containing protein n=1 Tax=Desmospora activa DSM 45169 TaxID=1121389 RepID=A0A2T4Z3L1_9BACL|nr:hypothetical protein [Desmospora activa]PTM56477.1 hypothetical protein C8J48_2799 [Desmospora activa DSM 45169]